ncbi:SET domain-containing protein [Lizonia empirigonia]|nr:SET domain-containing protein [Lizonia empirigonia]
MASHQNRNTVLLTEQEAARIRNTVRERLKKCSAQNGNAREPRDKTAAIQQATGASLLADMGGAPDPDMAQTQNQGGDTIPALAVGQPYPPCALPLADLQPMSLTDLKMDMHHRGRKLKINRVSPVVDLAARSWAMVQDEGEEIERLEVCLHKLRYSEDILESTKTFIIKEPYFTLTDQGEPTIRIDHISDLVVSREELLRPFFEDAAAAEKAATMCKNKGNAALKQQDFPLAYRKYSEGLKIANQSIVSGPNPDLARDISRNRAYVNLLLEQFDEAIADAHASLTEREDQRSKDLDSKAYYRAGCAAYNLGKYQEAKRFFERQEELVPGGKDAKIYLKKVGQRVRERETGSYDLMKIRSRLSRARSRVDMADFTKNTQVKGSAGRGRGLFAVRDIGVGEIILCEKAFCAVWGHETNALTAMTYDVRDDTIRFSPVGLTKALVQRLLNNPSTIGSFMNLHGDYKGDDKTVEKNEEGAVVDVFRVHDIMSRNAFDPGSQYGEEGPRNASTGLWVYAAYINHSCIANAKREFAGDMIIFRATRPIRTSEEIFQSYDVSLEYNKRQKILMTTWGFECDCELCTAEKADGTELRRKRRELMGEADAFIEGTPWAGAKRLAIRKAQRLAQSIDATYDEQRYKNLPRNHGEGIRAWLSKASPR